MVEAAERKAAGPHGKPNAFVNKTSAFLERMANRPPGRRTFDPSKLQPVYTGSRSPRSAAQQKQPQQGQKKQGDSQLTAALDTLASRRAPTGASGPSSTGERFSFRRDVASLDKLAASAGIDSSAGAVQKRRSYADKVAERQRGTSGGASSQGNTQTRFSLPGQGTGGRRSGGMQRQAGGQTKGPRQAVEGSKRPARTQSKMQLDEAERQRRLQERREQERPAAVAYRAPDLQELTTQLSMEDAALRKESGWASYKAVGRLLEQGHDATKLVATNRSIVPKQVVLKKISGWLPEVTPISSQPRA
jgi:hypothetical protein